MSDTAKLHRMLRAWEDLSQSLVTGYEFDLDEYLNDLDARQIIADGLSTVPVDTDFTRRLSEADHRVRDHAKIASLCLWGHENEAKEGWSQEQNWWYYAVPLRHEPQFADDLQRLS